MPGRRNNMALPAAGSGTITLVTPLPVSSGDMIQFATSGAEDIQYPWVYVTAHQDGVLVYGERRVSDDAPFKLGAGSSDWVNNGGGPADCRAELRYTMAAHGNKDWNGHGQQGATITLASVDFPAE